MAEASLEQLQEEWKEMFQKTLPAAATSKSPSQSSWPIHVDHCFARIILDLVVGVDTPWMEKVKSPAYKNMSEEQLRKSIDLSRQILEGAVDLVDLNNQSLALRGKDKNNRKRTQDTNEPTRSGANPKKRKTNSIREESTADASVPSAKKTPVQIEISPYFVKSRRIKESSGSIPSQNAGNIPIGKEAPKSLQEDLGPWLKKIAMSQRTPFQKKVLVALCQVPRGRYTTYNAISTYLSSSPRAVGNALRNNPFAPDVPCHRVLATGGSLGGFGGSWGRKGEAGLNDDKKRKLLRAEGVRFDGSGKVVGSAWSGFT